MDYLLIIVDEVYIFFQFFSKSGTKRLNIFPNNIKYEKRNEGADLLTWSGDYQC